MPVSGSQRRNSVPLSVTVARPGDLARAVQLREGTNPKGILTGGSTMKKITGTIMLLLAAFLLLIPVTAYSLELCNGETSQMFTDSESKTYVQEEVTVPDYCEKMTAPAVESKTSKVFINTESADTGFEVDIYFDVGVKELSGRQPVSSGWI